MSRVMRYGNLKAVTSAPGAGAFAAAGAGPYNPVAVSTHYFAPVPCRGARMVVWRIVAAGSGNFANTSTVWMTNNADGQNAYTAGSAEASPIGEGALDADPGSAVLAVTPTLAGTLLTHDFAILVLTNDGTNAKTGLTVVAEVWYDTEAEVAMKEFGQSGLTTFVY